ncbi:MAG: hypothetical protein JSW11_03800 [Candidatus Heimdallarchaeota archaeon]|nr:MAG: hypothetical protein JSW11_03800 [Candidatus Heimdallarchaeota archaeon]
MKIQTSDADEVFNKWLTKVDSKKLKKSFGIEKEAITAAESVKNVEKSAFLFFYSEIQKKKSLGAKEQKPEKINASKLADITFYSFSSEGVKTDTWKEKKDFVPLIKNLKELRCKRCDGKGTEKCGHCNNSRLITCDECKGKEIKCDKCKGSGNHTITLEVKEINKKGEEKTSKIEKATRCPSCFGSGKFNCHKCGGTGKIVCYECKGNPKTCRECNGHGLFYEFYKSPVPLIITPSKQFYSFMVKKDEWMLKDKYYNQKLESAESYPFQDPRDLNEKELKELFGVISLDKELRKCIEDTKKAFEEMEKEYKKGKSFERPLRPILLVFLLRMYIETPKRKKFDIYALGTKNKYIIMTNQF